MLKTNSKKARENIKNYIVENFTPDSYTDTPPEKWHDIAVFIFATFRKEKYCYTNDFRYYGNCEFDAFVDWCSGLPSVLDTCYYYNRSAVNDLGNILEQTENEKERFTENKAAWALTYLIYSELIKEENKK